ncbi:hypothetical protein P7K49_010004 [Saguinus oedipus]|uniref:Uncharacterized protein n=1 Tax=Saguinus oedipus TaxID=9490 RepID=A0ABQ9VNW0_SAGOE|nr:hypothetical protein P7K49_010004 [Saguinus oedipus]
MQDSRSGLFLSSSGSLTSIISKLCCGFPSEQAWTRSEEQPFRQEHTAFLHKAVVTTEENTCRLGLQGVSHKESPTSCHLRLHTGYSVYIHYRSWC